MGEFRICRKPDNFIGIELFSLHRFMTFCHSYSGGIIIDNSEYFVSAGPGLNSNFKHFHYGNYINRFKL